MIVFIQLKGALRVFDNPVLVGLAVPLIPAQLGSLSQVGAGDVQDKVEVGSPGNGPLIQYQVLVTTAPLVRGHRDDPACGIWVITYV